MRKFGIFILILVIIAALMYFTNPDDENFSKYLDRVSSRNITQYASGTQGIDETNVDDFKNATFTSEDNYIYSIFSITSPSSVSDFVYLGMFGVFFKLS